jgi:hypothetical protein
VPTRIRNLSDFWAPFTTLMELVTRFKRIDDHSEGMHFRRANVEFCWPATGKLHTSSIKQDVHVPHETFAQMRRGRGLKAALSAGPGAGFGNLPLVDHAC